MKICVIAGMIDAKLHSKVAPIQAIKEVTQIDIIRRQPFSGEKIISHTPPRLFRWFLPLAELWRFSFLIFLACFRRPNAIIAFGIIPHGIYAWWIGRIFNIPVIQHVMGKNDLRLTFPDPAGRAITLSAVKAAASIAVRGERMKEWLISKGAYEDSIFVPQNLHDFSLFDADPKKNTEFDFIYVGLLSPYKRVDLMLEALHMAHMKGNKFTLLLVGDGGERVSLEKKAAQYGLQSAVCFAGKKSFNELPDYYNKAKVFIMTSQGEGLPMAMLEALSCKLPVIVPDDADIKEIAIEGENALIVSPPIAEGFAAAMVKIFNDEQVLRHLQEGAVRFREKYKTIYSLDYQTDVWHTALSGIIPS